ncbi:hypothetical protein [Spiroplasma floricola]|uniref:Uncharacterized protein n=1 Tax=Spiroplasma floricola 23-6 TaxID=1336749 RepID=A0A2K8SCU7_9MOLU|nr:hypothetical protein [Spiroplasma floricola]AUB31284.1 hypothetical protein SFLOR_v1c02230 [Spiroplasma floricola 23-6]
MQILEQIISIIGAIVILFLIIFIWKYLKYQKILRKMNKAEADEITITVFFRVKTYYRFVLKKKIRLYKLILLILLIIFVILLAISGGVKYA